MNNIKHFRNISPRNAKQKLLMELIDDKDLIFAMGSAGSGKTLLAVNKALKAIKEGTKDKIIVCRPAVAMEDLGFLPGDLKEKVDPYLLPIYDCFDFLGGPNLAEDLIKDNLLEIAALGFMRGRTLNNSFIILDEAQNTTPSQMQMFLTRFGDNVKVVITGDATQTDIKGENGLTWAHKVLKNSDVTTFIEFSNKEVVRSALVRSILKSIDSSNNLYEKTGTKKSILPYSETNLNGDLHFIIK